MKKVPPAANVITPQQKSQFVNLLKIRQNLIGKLTTIRFRDKRQSDLYLEYQHLMWENKMLRQQIAFWNDRLFMINKLFDHEIL